MRFAVNYENVGFTSEEFDPDEPIASPDEIKAVSDLIFETSNLRLLDITASIDDSVYKNGRDDYGDIKIFVSTIIEVEADNEDEALDFQPPEKVFRIINEKFLGNLDMEDDWEANGISY